MQRQTLPERSQTESKSAGESVGAGSQASAAAATRRRAPARTGRTRLRPVARASLPQPPNKRDTLTRI